MEKPIPLHLVRMKYTLIALFLLAFAVQLAQAQSHKVPKNLKQALKLLQADCPDSLKSIIKKTDDGKLINLCYPWDTPNTIPYKTIFEWLRGDDNDTKKLDKYFTNKGIKDNQHQQTVVLIAFKKILLGQPVNQDSIFKPYQQIEAKWKKEDAVRSTTDSLRGHYIPKDLDDCLSRLDKMFSDSDKVTFKKLPEREFIGRVHHGFGTWIRNNWGLHMGSRLWVYFNSMGISNPEDMSGIIFHSYHRRLLNNPLKLDEQMQFYKDYWADAERKELEETRQQFATYNLGDTLEYNYPNGYVSKKQEDAEFNDSCAAKGIVLQKDDKKLLLKVRIIETCDSHGIITYDSKNSYTFDKELKKWVKVKKRKIVKSKSGKELWFNYEDWKSNDSYL